ncbi:MAG: autotransporter-associated beta strand repeat-containing protein, partial [Cephaloticoccus sp.]|nr:autotransporter-associated beta strand repeat-containing protein [Cephaloticoccus sp.]
MNVNRTAGQVWFTANSSAIAFEEHSNDRTLTIDASNGDGLVHAGDVTHVFNANLALGSDQTWYLTGSSGAIEVNDDFDLGSYTLTLNTANPGNTVIISSTKGAVVGSGGFIKTGAGNLVFSGANTYTGTTTVNGGTVVVSHADGLGSDAGGTVVNSGGTLELTGNITIASEGLTVNGSGRLLNAADSNAYSGAISGTGGVDVTGGILTLNGNSSYSGSTDISGTGALIAASNNALGTGGGTTTVSGDASLGLQNNVTIASESNLNLSGGGYLGLGSFVNVSGTNYWEGDITLGSDVTFNTLAGAMVVGEYATYTDDLNLGANDLTLTGASGSSIWIASEITGTGGLTKTGANDVFLLNTNSYIGATTISEGSVIYAVNNVLSDTTAVTVEAAGTLNFNNFSDTVGSIAGDGDITLGSGNLTVGGNNTSTAFGGEISGTGDFTKTGSGTLTLSGSNSYTGTTTVDAGTLAYDADDVIATGAVTVAGGTLDLGNNHSDTVGTITLTSGNITGTGTSTLTSTGTFEMESGIVTAGLGGSVDLNKTTAGTVTLSGTNTYSGTTTVSAGTLLAQSNGALGSTSGDVTVTSG